MNFFMQNYSLPYKDKNLRAHHPVTAVDTLIFILALFRKIAFLYDIENFLYGLNAPLEILFRKINLFNAIIAPGKTEKPFLHIDIVVFPDHKRLQNELVFIGLVNRIPELGKLVLERCRRCIVKEQDFVNDPLDVIAFGSDENIHLLLHDP